MRQLPACPVSANLPIAMLPMLYVQVLSAVVRHFTRGMAPVSMVCKAKTAAHAWGLTSSEVQI